MAKLLADLPAGLVLKARGPEGSSLARNAVPSAPSGDPQPSPAPTNRDGRAQAPKALQRPQGKSTLDDHSDWMMRRCEAFGIASSRYFKKNATCPAPTKK